MKTTFTPCDAAWSMKCFAPIVTNLNVYYNGSAVYAQSTVQGTSSGNDVTFGNGPNAIVYNTKTLQLLNSIGVGTPLGATNGEYRQVMRYEFQPIGGTAASDFYVYVTHMKSSGSDTGQALFNDESSRAKEAAIIRADEATLPATASVLYMGDFNLSGSAPISFGGQSVSAYQMMTAAGQGKAIDPLNNPENDNITWDSNTAYKAILTETAKDLRYRDDLQLMTQNVFSGSQPLGLAYVSGSLHAFGNNGSVGVGDSVNSGSNTALDDLEPDPPIGAATLLADLTTASDHLPVVADYTFAVPEPGAVALLMIGCIVLLLFRASGSWRRSSHFNSDLA